MTWRVTAIKYWIWLLSLIFHYDLPVVPSTSLHFSYLLLPHHLFCSVLFLSTPHSLWYDIQIVGGAGVADQIADLKRGAEIVVCTPGRMIDILCMQAGKLVNLRRVTMVVLDEADRWVSLIRIGALSSPVLSCILSSMIFISVFCFFILVVVALVFFKWGCWHAFIESRGKSIDWWSSMASIFDIR